MADASRDIDVLVIGELNPDILVSDPDPTPAFGQIERIVRSISMTVGSSSAIMACGAARLGLRVAFFGVVGEDPFGVFMLDALRDRGVDVSACIVDPTRPTGASVILTRGEDRAILTGMGTIGAMDVRALPPALLDRARHVHSASFYLQDTSRERLPELFADLRRRGTTTSFDTNWDPTGRWEGGVKEMIAACDVFFPNAEEARKIAGIDDLEEAARTVARLGGSGRTDGGPVIAVKLGPEGGLACRADEPIVRVSAMKVDPIDTTGAGDSFDAGFLAAMLDGASIEEALRMGTVCGALSTLRLGGVDGQPTRSEAEAAIAADRAP